MAVILDSDAVVGFLDRGDALHAAADAAIRELAREHRLVASVITYAEVLTGARLGHHGEDHVVGFATADIRADIDLILTADVRTAKIPHLDCDVRLLEPMIAES